MNLDINTPKGQLTLEQEQTMLAAFVREFPQFRALQTPKHKHAAVDGVLETNGMVSAVFELKCRNMSCNSCATILSTSGW